jgi:O-acetyl-ADP-ribose deacetylase (regulator of RNase III)
MTQNESLQAGLYMSDIDTKKVKVFISYRNSPESIEVGHTLANNLRNLYHYEIFIDTHELKDKAGVNWLETIYQNICDSDVLVVLLERNTYESDWVQREVDIARGAHVSLLPVAIIPAHDIDEVIEETQDRLAIGQLQYIRFTGDDPEGEYEALVESIERLSEATRDNQKRWREALDEKRHPRPASTNNPAYISYGLPQFGERQVCLATGDMTELQGIDVLVNSENTYMQMARIFESTTLSSAIRREGSFIKNGRLFEDPIQEELDQQISKSSYFGSRPIEIEQVVPTHAGHPQSQLVKNGARYILHAATVYVHPRDRTMTPIRTSESIREVVFNCLNLFLDIQRLEGVISPKGTKHRKQEEKDQGTYLANPITSIVFPLFGTGKGGQSIIQVAPAMILAFKDFLDQQRNNPDCSLKRIHLCVYAHSDIDDVDRAFQKIFKKMIVNS